MKYEEIKIGDFYNVGGFKEEVIAKVDKSKSVVTVDDDGDVTTWGKDELHFFEPLKEQLPEEGLLVSSSGSLVYKLTDGSGYGFALGKQFMYFFNKAWGFSVDYWKPATLEQEKKFVEMLKIECEKRGLFENTKIENHADGTSLAEPDYMGVWVRFTSIKGYNKNGQIFHKGKFATPRKKELLDKVTQVVNEFGNHIIEQTESGVIILTPKK